ncbi:MAG: hypothetical protein BHW58_03620 [Azospirillum sp. 51_20]|jgi:hypothetical protein|nr:MAG: hypothetical protein BHW58_03620 [Azospirillum sp. 51_20]
MSISKKVFGLALGAVLATNVGSASAQQAAPADDDKAEELLFKIHDITPVENREGEVIACDFNTTFYNRSGYNLKEAMLDFTWKDTSLEDVIKQEKEEDAEKQNRNANRAYSETERRTSKDVNIMIEVPAIKPYKQVTVNNRINTDRCFLLIEKVDFSVKSCSAEGLSGGRSARSASRRSPCSRLFKYVSPEDAQYYLDFKEITPDEENSREEAEKQESKDEVAGTYAKTIDALNSAGSIIGGIK